MEIPALFTRFLVGHLANGQLDPDNLHLGSDPACSTWGRYVLLGNVSAQFDEFRSGLTALGRVRGPSLSVNAVSQMLGVLFPPNQVCVH